VDTEVLRVVMEIVGFFALAVAGIWGFPFAAFGMAALGIALGIPADDAHTYAEFLEALRCDESCGSGGGWQFTKDAWQWTALGATASAGITTLWLSVALAVIAGAMGAVPRVRHAARRLHLLAAVAMAIAVASFGMFTIIVAPLGDRYGI